MRISDWSSDVCSSDLYTAFGPGIAGGVGSESTQVFRSDGTFTDSSFTGAFGSFDTGGGFTATTGQPERSGHYDVAGGPIILIPPEGAPRVPWLILEDVNRVLIGGERKGGGWGKWVTVRFGLGGGRL